MNVIQKIKDGMIQLKYARFFSILACFFALIYHVSFLFVFKFLGVQPMFYFNFFSVSLFTILTIIILKKDLIVQVYPFFYAEVVLHQIFADYYVGGDASFHFFILLMGILPLLSFKKKPKQAIFYGALSFIFFSLLEIFSTDMPGVYQVSSVAIRTIKSINLVLTIFSNLAALMVYTLILWNIETNLITTVQRQELEKASQNKKILIMQNNIISSLASLVENRDTDTGEHIKRTSLYVELIAKEAFRKGIYKDQITKDFINLAKRAAPLHDVGKIMISDTVLKKPGRLTPEEFEIIKIHAKEGGRIISEVVGISEDKEFVRIASEIATYHHEKWDGSGYPYGKKEQEIPVSARIMALADVFDALVSVRCYKKQMTQEEAIAIIKDGSGKHFDPVLVDVFLSVQDKVTMIMTRFSN